MLVARPKPPSPPHLEPVSASTILPRSSISTIATLQSATSGPSSASPAVTPNDASPIVKDWTVQPRPKPGRKPATDVPATRRKQQNRDSQRAFRERRAERVEDLEKELQQERQRYRQEEARWAQERIYHNQLQAHWHELQQQLAKNHWEMRQTAEAWRERAMYVESQCAQYHGVNDRLREQVARHESVASHNGALTTSQAAEAPQPPVQVNQIVPGLPTANEASCRTCDPAAGNCACLEAMTQPHNVDDVEEDAMEIDFTNMRPSSNHEQAVGVINQDADAAIVTDGCGFCHAPGGTECPCETLARSDAETRNTPTVTTTAPPPNPSNLGVNNLGYGPIINRSPTIAPGSCDACQIDPDRRRFCQTLASSVPMAMPPPAIPSLSTGTSTTNSSPPSTSVAHNPPHPQPSTSTVPSIQSTITTTGDSSHISCNEAYTRFQKYQSQSQSHDHTGYVQRLRAQLHDCNEDEATGSATPDGGHQGHVHNGRSCAPLEVEVASVLVAMGEMERERRESMRNVDVLAEQNRAQAEGIEDRDRKRKRGASSGEDEKEMPEGDMEVDCDENGDGDAQVSAYARRKF